MKKLLIYVLLAAMILTFVACKENDDPKADEKDAYVFIGGGVSIAVDAEVAPILASLGEWQTYDESPSCAFEGLDKIYTYGGFEIRTYPQGGKDFVHSVILYDDTVAIEKDIRIGSTADAVKTAYGTPDEETTDALIYRAKGMLLQFLLEGGQVTSIQYCKVQ